MGSDPEPLSEPADNPGSSALVDLVEGRWSRWSGLASSTTLDDADAQLGASLHPDAHSGMFIGPTMFRPGNAGPGAPGGFIVWFEGTTVAGVQIHGAQRDPTDRPLPEPELELESGLGGPYRQLVWGRRGLVLHQASEDGPIAELLLGLRPFDAAQWESNPLRWVSRTRHRR